MKAIKFLLLAMLLSTFAACNCQNCAKEDAGVAKSAAVSSAAKKTPAAAIQAKIDASKKCSADSDCIAVSKGCCQCDGKDSINKKYLDEVKEYTKDTCGMQVCTMQFCMNDIDNACVKGKCTGTLKENSFKKPL